MLVIRSPKGHFVDPVCLTKHSLTESQRFKYLDAAALQTISLAVVQGTLPRFNDPGCDGWKPRELGC